MNRGIHKIARRLLEDGYVDDEVDARLAAMKILVAAAERDRTDRTGTPTPDDRGGSTN